jgi:topoisomerase IA-like protein
MSSWMTTVAVVTVGHRSNATTRVGRFGAFIVVVGHRDRCCIYLSSRTSFDRWFRYDGSISPEVGP